MDDDGLHRLAKLLKNGRMRAGLSERDMAVAMSRSARFVRSYESAKVSLTIEELEQVASILGLSIVDLIADFKRGQ